VFVVIVALVAVAIPIAISVAIPIPIAAVSIPASTISASTAVSSSISTLRSEVIAKVEIEGPFRRRNVDVEGILNRITQEVVESRTDPRTNRAALPRSLRQRDRRM
jgi:hypothetical protein